MSAPINGCNFDFGNEPGKYTLIYADPPWQYRDKAKDGERGVDFKYSTMNLQDIKRLPVWDLAAESCLLAMWHVGPMPREALDVMEAWGFRLFNMKGFTWHKIHAKSGKDCMGMGNLTRSNTEDCLFAIKGRLPERMMANILQHVSAEEHVTAARGEHSAKPAIFADKLVQLLGNVPRIELFARTAKEGWHHWGDQCKCDVEFVPASFKVLNMPDPNYDPDLDGPWNVDDI